jgi:hypothetical protein
MTSTCFLTCSFASWSFTSGVTSQYFSASISGVRSDMRWPTLRTGRAPTYDSVLPFDSCALKAAMVLELTEATEIAPTASPGMLP